MRIFDESQLRGKGSDCVQWNGILRILNHLTPEVTDKGRSFSVLYIHHPPMAPFMSGHTISAASTKGIRSLSAASAKGIGFFSVTEVAPRRDSLSLILSQHATSGMAPKARMEIANQPYADKSGNRRSMLIPPVSRATSISTSTNNFCIPPSCCTRLTCQGDKRVTLSADSVAREAGSCVESPKQG